MNNFADIAKDCSKLAKEYGSPLYIYSLDKVHQRISELREYLPNDSGIYFSLKPNPLPALSNEAVRNNCHLEVTSINELLVAVDTGISADGILFSGPGKTETEIRKSFDCDVKLFSVEGWTDLKRVDSIAKELGKNVRVILRVNPDQSLRSGLSMSGLPTQFGFEEIDLIENWDNTKNLSRFSVVEGFHIYYGSQIYDAETLTTTFRLGIECVERICERHHYRPKLLDLGGGFPWSYARVQEDSTISDLPGLVNSAMEIRNYTKNSELWFESGRYITASSGTLVSTVLVVKEAKNQKRFVILDSGINHLGGMSGLGRIPRDYAGIVSLENRHLVNEGQIVLSEATVVGPLCSPLDCIARKAQLPKDIQPGDLVAIPNVGAYGLTASLVAFLSKPAPMEIAIRNGDVIAVEQLLLWHKSLSNEQVNI